MIEIGERLIRLDVVTKRMDTHIDTTCGKKIASSMAKTAKEKPYSSRKDVFSSFLSILACFVPQTRGTDFISQSLESRPRYNCSMATISQRLVKIDAEVDKLNGQIND